MGLYRRILVLVAFNNNTSKLNSGEGLFLLKKRLS
jgi:hypothetical protein